MNFIPKFRFDVRVVVLLVLWSQRGGISLTSSIKYVLSLVLTLESRASRRKCLLRLSAGTNLFCWSRQSGVVGRQLGSRIGFNAAAVLNDFLEMIFTSLSGVCPDIVGLLCCVSSDCNAATALYCSRRAAFDCDHEITGCPHVIVGFETK
jgi:hypothetical protein